jgi:hypothetical protein
MARTPTRSSDTVPPVITVEDVTVECAGPMTPVSPRVSAVDDVDGPVPVTCVPGSADYPVGSTTNNCSASDSSNNTAHASFVVTVRDTASPQLALTPSPAVLWPPNHKLVPIALGQATDACDPNPAIVCDVTSNEPPDSTGDGTTASDIVWDQGQLYLRAERKGNGSGRVYTITCTSTDSSGNQTTQTATVRVPHSQGR